MFSQGEAKGFGFVLGRKKQRKEIWTHNHLKLPSSSTVFSVIDQRLGATVLSDYLMDNPMLFRDKAGS
jgi:hypothetical protein